MSKNKVYFLILTILVLVTYVNSLNNAFLSDDLAEIVNNPKVGDLWYGIQTHPTGFIRPVIYWLAFVLGGLNPLLFRLSNILFHLGSTILVFLTINNLLKSRQIALFTSALFAVHPAIAEGVVWISGGMYTQYTFFFLFSFLFYIKSAGNRFIYLLSSISL